MGFGVRAALSWIRSETGKDWFYLLNGGAATLQGPGLVGVENLLASENMLNRCERVVPHLIAYNEKKSTYKEDFHANIRAMKKR